MLLHRGDQRIIHGFVAHTVRQPIEAGLDQRFGVVHIENMRRNLDAVLVGVGDDGFAQIDGNLFFAAQMIVHPDLDDVDFLVRQVRDIFVHIARAGNFEGNALHALRRGRVTARAREAAPGREYAGFVRASGVLRGAQLEDQVPIGSHADHRRHTVGSVKLQLLLDVFGGVIFGVLCEIERVAEVPVQIDDSRHDEFAGEVRDLGARGNFELCLRSGPSDAPVHNDHGRARDRGASCAVDEREPIKHRGFSQCRAGRESHHCCEKGWFHVR